MGSKIEFRLTSERNENLQQQRRLDSEKGQENTPDTSSKQPRAIPDRKGKNTAARSTFKGKKSSPPRISATIAAANLSSQKEARQRIKDRNRPSAASCATGPVADQIVEPELEPEPEPEAREMLPPIDEEMEIGSGGAPNLDISGIPDEFVPPSQASQASVPPSTLADRIELTSRNPLQRGSPPEPSIASQAPLDQGSLIRILDARLGALAKTVDVNRVMERVDQNAANFTRLEIKLQQTETIIRENRLTLERQIREITASAANPVASQNPSSRPQNARPTLRVPDSPFLAGARSCEQELGRLRQFEESRRTVRIWPIEGDNARDLEDGVKDFLAHALQMHSYEINELEILGIKRMRENKDSGIYNEVSFTVRDATARDEVFSRGPMLAGYVDRQRRPTAGLRMDVPPYLESTFRLLNNVGYELRLLHGKGTKKYVKYDDDSLDLYLEVRPEGKKAWNRIDSKMAREFKRESDRKGLLTLARSCPEPSSGDLPANQLQLTNTNLVPLGARRDPPRLPSPEDDSQNAPMSEAEDDNEISLKRPRPRLGESGRNPSTYRSTSSTSTPRPGALSDPPPRAMDRRQDDVPPSDRSHRDNFGSVLLKDHRRTRQQDQRDPAPTWRPGPRPGPQPG